MMTPISVAKQNLRNSYKAYTKYKKESVSERKTWLLALAESRAQQELTSNAERRPRKITNTQATAKHIQMILQVGGTRRMYRRINNAVGKRRMQGVTMVLEKTLTGEWVERNTPDGIFKALTKEYHAKYHQTENTPPIRTPLVNMLGYLGTNQRSDQVLQGSFETVPGLQNYSS